MKRNQGGDPILSIESSVWTERLRLERDTIVGSTRLSVRKISSRFNFHFKYCDTYIYILHSDHRLTVESANLNKIKVGISFYCKYLSYLKLNLSIYFV